MEQVQTKVNGVVKEIFAEEAGSSQRGDYVKQCFLITTKGQYGKDVFIGSFGKMTNEVEKLKENQDVTVYVNLDSKEHNGKWYNNITAYKIEVNNKEAIKEEIKNSVQEEEEDDDLPF